MENRRQQLIWKFRHLIHGLLVALVFAIGSASPAWADDDETAYKPAGLGTLFSRPDLANGHDPTLYEAYPESAYTLDFVSDGLFSFDNVDASLNAIADVVFMGTRFMTNAAITLTWQNMTLDAYSALGAQLTEGIGQAANAFSTWLLPSTLVIGALVVFMRAKSDTGKAINQLLLVGLAGVATLSLASHPDAWLSGANAGRHVGIEAATAVSVGTTSQVDTPIPGPTPSFGADEDIKGMRLMGDAIWRTYVVTPWCLAEFGSQAACAKWGEQVLAKTGTEKINFIKNDIRGSIGGQNSEAYKVLSGHYPSYRIGIALVSLLSATAFAIVAIGINLLVAANMMLALIMLVVGGFFTCLWAIPGAPRQWANQWFSTLVGFTIMTFVGLIVLSAALAITASAILLSATMGWITSILLSFTGLGAAFSLMGILRNIFSAPTTGANGVIGKTIAVGFMAKNLLGSRRRSSLMRSSEPNQRAEPARNDHQRVESGAGEWKRGTTARRGRRALTLGPRHTSAARQGSQSKKINQAPGHDTGHGHPHTDSTRSYSPDSRRSFPTRASIHQRRDSLGAPLAENRRAEGRSLEAMNTGRAAHGPSLQMQVSPPRRVGTYHVMPLSSAHRLTARSGVGNPRLRDNPPQRTITVTRGQ